MHIYKHTWALQWSENEIDGQPEREREDLGILPDDCHVSVGYVVLLDFEAVVLK